MRIQIFSHYDYRVSFCAYVHGSLILHVGIRFDTLRMNHGIFPAIADLSSNAFSLVARGRGGPVYPTEGALVASRLEEIESYYDWLARPRSTLDAGARSKTYFSIDGGLSIVADTVPAASVSNNRHVSRPYLCGGA